MNEPKRARMVINPGDWSKPQCGTPNQHRAITLLAQKMGYESMIDFLTNWRTYNKVKEPDGSLRPLQASFVFQHSRKKLLIYKNGIPLYKIK